MRGAEQVAAGGEALVEGAEGVQQRGAGRAGLRGGRTPWLTAGLSHASSCSISSRCASGYVSITGVARCRKRVAKSMPMPLKSLLTTWAVPRSHSVGTETWPSKPSSVASYACAQQREAVDRVGAVALPERPAAAVARVVDVGHRDDVAEAGEGMGDRHALRPRAEPARVEVVAARLRVVDHVTGEAVQRAGVVGLLQQCGTRHGPSCRRGWPDGLNAAVSAWWSSVDPELR